MSYLKVEVDSKSVAVMDAAYSEVERVRGGNAAPEPGPRASA
jgi:hypothetical protein